MKYGCVTFLNNFHFRLEFSLIKFCFRTFSEASGLSGFLSGWYLSASFRYVFLISSGVAVLDRPKISYNVSPEVLNQSKKNEKIVMNKIKTKYFVKF